MPTRILREGIISSERVNALSERAELFYRKLHSVADDYGRFYSNPISILGACYPMRPTVSIDDVKQMLSECVANNLVVIYGGGKYIVILEFRQQTRSPSKFPEPSKDELLIKCKASVKQMCRVGEGVGEGEGVCVGGVAHAPFPDGNIPTWNEIKLVATMRAVSEESAKKFFDHHEGNGLWINQHGKLINWQHKLVAWAANDRAKPQKTGEQKPISKMTHKEMLAEAIR